MIHKIFSTSAAAVVITVLLTFKINAVTATPSATPTTPVSKKVEDLKDRLATKVAQLRQSERRAMFGAVKDKTLTSITIETKTKDIKIELTDNIVVVQNLKAKRTILTTEDVSKGDVVTVFGDYDVTLDLLKAKVIFIEGELPSTVSGVISEVNKTDFTLTLTTASGQTYAIDIENATKTLRWMKEKGIEKGGFSKVAIGDTVHVVGFPVAKKENRISASRILDIGNLTGAIPTPTPTEEITPKASPSASSKTTPKPTLKPTVTPTPTP